jgi:sporulation protein YlmC with PRC-barrel domain
MTEGAGISFIMLERSRSLRIPVAVHRRFAPPEPLQRPARDQGDTDGPASPWDPFAMPINILAGGGEPWIRDGVRGEAISIKSAASPAWARSSDPEGGNDTSGTYRWWTCETWLVASAPGIQPVWVTSSRHMTRERYLIPGLRVPVTISQKKSTRVRIEWDEVPKIDDLIARGDPLFTNPDATRPLIRDAMASAGVAPPPPRPREEIDGPNARVISFGGGGPDGNPFTNKRKVDLLLSVAIPGRARFGYRWQGKAPTDRLVQPGTNIRVLYDPARPDEVDIPWDEVGVKKADMLQAAKAMVRAVRNGQAVPAASAPSLPPDQSPGDSVALLERLSNLRAAGVLTDEEFAAEKARVLRKS